MRQAHPLPPVRAAQYVRMSTEHQNYSLEHQRAAIASYAASRGFEIVRTYADRGISGLSLSRRDGLKALLGDVVAGAADFQAVLIYDVSRWGRFQDVDESAHYEFLCRQAGVRIEYCAEPFDNDGSLAAMLLKHIKRAMAGEFSRELSAKVALAQGRLAAQGYWQGGPAGYGLRRRVVAPDGTPGPQLEAGQRKALVGDRVVLEPGPDHEIETVRRIYRLFVIAGLSRAAVARTLNSEGIAAEGGAAWTAKRVEQVLANEKYAGVLVFGKTRCHLRHQRTRQPRTSWSRSEGALAPLVSRAMFESARRNMARRFTVLPEAGMLAGLETLLARHGRITADLIRAAEGLPCPEAYRRRFGGLVAAYARVGYTPSGRALRASQVSRRGSPCGRRNRPDQLSDEELLARLRALLEERGALTEQIIRDAPGTPGSQVYRRAFGSMTRAYELVGYAPTEKQRRAAALMTARLGGGALVSRPAS
jgi:DNA invertase Pin-like site-specific DNA recombinase